MKVQVNVWMPRSFVRFIDETAKLTGSTRSDLIRRAIEHYIAELKQVNLLSDLKGVRTHG
jgi:metal-responsive CopG/Arc/MetJ family transcriptional regulator